MNPQPSPEENDLDNRVSKNRALQLLRWACPERLVEEIEGDLIQRYARECITLGTRRANRRLSWNALRFLRPGILLRRRWNFHIKSFYMFSNYFRTATRIMRRNTGYTSINVLGLALGMTGAMLLGLWVAHELSFDQFHDDIDRMHIVWNREKQKNGVVACWSATPRVLAPTLKSDFAAVESSVSYADYSDSYLFISGDKRILKNRGTFVDSNFLQMFSFPLQSGDIHTALNNPNSIVLTASFARMLFENGEALGEEITIAQGEYKFPFIVTGILEDLPANTALQFEYLLPFSFIESNFGKDEQWQNNSVVTFVKVRQGASSGDLNEQIRDIKKKNIAGEETELFLYPFAKNRLYSRFENGVPSGGRIEIVRMIGLLAVILVIIACINFINLSTARASRRTKEVGVRKVTGATRSSLITQFLCESVLLTAAAGIISIAAAYLLLPSFNVLMQQQLKIQWGDFFFWSAIGISIVTVGLLAGGYPAFYLSSLMPVRILRGWTDAPGRNRLRSILVVMQFGFALTLIVSTIVVHRQTRFLQQRDVGYDRSHLIYEHLTGTLPTNFNAYRQALLSTGYVTSVTCSSSPVTQRLSNTSAIQWSGKDPGNKTVIERFSIDQHLSRTMGVKIIQGRDLDLEQFPSDTAAALINEAALALMQFENPIGEEIEDSGRKWRIVGVVKNFVFSWPYGRVEPIIMQGARVGTDMSGVAHIRISAGKPINEALEAISKVTIKLNPDYPFEYEFVDREYARRFSNEKTTLSISTVFSALAIFIGCLGLLGLATFQIEARMKEIGIRKVLGGSVYTIVRLLSGYSLRPILLAILLFGPGAWWAMNWWLQSYEYRIQFSWWIIPLSAGLILLLALSTVIFQIYKAARTNPVSTLKSE